MKKKSIVFAAATAASVALLCLSPRTAAAQGYRGAAVKQAEAMPTPKDAAGHPDLSGFYNAGVSGVVDYGKTATGAEAGNLVTAADGSIFFDYAGAEGGAGHPDDGSKVVQNTNQPPYKPEYMAKVKAIAATIYGTITAEDPFLECKPAGVPRASIGGGALQIVQNPRYIALLYENDPGPQYRLIYTDGRQHPSDLDTSFMGNSIGHWDGDTLVVDTVGLNEETWYTQAGGANKFTSIHSDKEHVVERFTRKGNDLAYDASVEDPVMLSRPWEPGIRHTRIGPSDDYIQPQACNTNDKAHIIQPSANDQFQCNFCQKNADQVYGENTPKPENGTTGTGQR